MLLGYLYQWQIQDFEKGGGNDISKVDLRILDSGGGALRAEFALSTVATVTARYTEG